MQRLVAVMNDRSRDQVRNQERDDKLRALGKLSAGLAHELNNPAAAIARAAQALAERAASPSPRYCCSQLLALSARLAAALCAPLPRLAAPVPATLPPAPAPLAAGALGTPKTSWPTGSTDPGRGRWLPPGPRPCSKCRPSPNDTLAAAANAAASLRPAPSRLPGWKGSKPRMQLIRDVQEAGSRISKLVADVKTYSHMDRDGGFRAARYYSSGLDSTLNMLGFQLRQKNVKASSATTPPSLPPIRGQVSSLNQVWTNLIDNAVDALPAQGGELTLRVPPRGRLRARLPD